MRRRILTTGTAVLTAAAAVLSGCGTAKENQGGREAENGAGGRALRGGF